MDTEIQYEHLSKDVVDVFLKDRRIGIIKPVPEGYQFFPEGAVYAFKPAQELEDLKYNLRYNRGQARTK